jgi:hypothetical protein
MPICPASETVGLAAKTADVERFRFKTIDYEWFTTTVKAWVLHGAPRISTRRRL